MQQSELVCMYEGYTPAASPKSSQSPTRASHRRDALLNASVRLSLSPQTFTVSEVGMEVDSCVSVKVKEVQRLVLPAENFDLL